MARVRLAKTYGSNSNRSHPIANTVENGICQVTIANTAQETSLADLGGYCLTGVFCPASLTATTIGFTAGVGDDSATLCPLIEDDGTAYEIVVASSKFCPVDLTKFVSVRWLKLTTNAGESGANTITLTVKPIV